MNKDVISEIRHIHEKYDKEGGKAIKPSFNYIVVVDSSYERNPKEKTQY